MVSITAFRHSLEWDGAEEVDRWVCAGSRVAAIVRLARHDKDAAVKTEALRALRLMMLRAPELSDAARATFAKWMVTLVPLAGTECASSVRIATLDLIECTARHVPNTVAPLLREVRTVAFGALDDGDALAAASGRCLASLPQTPTAWSTQFVALFAQLIGRALRVCPELAAHPRMHSVAQAARAAAAKTQQQPRMQLESSGAKLAPRQRRALAAECASRARCLGCCLSAPRHSMAVTLPGSDEAGNHTLELVLALLDSLTDKLVAARTTQLRGASASDADAEEEHAAVDAMLCATALELLTTLMTVLRRHLLGYSRRIVVTLLGGASRASPESRRAWFVAIRQAIVTFGAPAVLERADAIVNCLLSALTPTGGNAGLQQTSIAASPNAADRKARKRRKIKQRADPSGMRGSDLLNAGASASFMCALAGPGERWRASATIAARTLTDAITVAGALMAPQLRRRVDQALVELLWPLESIASGCDSFYNSSLSRIAQVGGRATIHAAMHAAVHSDQGLYTALLQTLLASTLAPIAGAQSPILSPALLIFRQGSRALSPAVARFSRTAVAALDPIVHGRCVPLQAPTYAPSVVVVAAAAEPGGDAEAFGESKPSSSLVNSVPAFGSSIDHDAAAASAPAPVVEPADASPPLRAQTHNGARTSSAAEVDALIGNAVAVEEEPVAEASSSAVADAVHSEGSDSEGFELPDIVDEDSD